MPKTERRRRELVEDRGVARRVVIASVALFCGNTPLIYLNSQQDTISSRAKRQFYTMVIALAKFENEDVQVNSFLSLDAKSV